MEINPLERHPWRVYEYEQKKRCNAKNMFVRPFMPCIHASITLMAETLTIAWSIYDGRHYTNTI